MRAATIAAMMICTLSTSAEAGDVKKLAATLHEIRSKPAQEVFVRVKTGEFELIRLDEHDISQAEFEQAVATSHETPALEFSRNGIALSIPQHEDDAVLAYSATGAQAPSRWKRRTATVIEKYPRRQWREFLGTAIAEGLFQYVRHKSAYGEFAELRFRRPSPASVQSQGGAIVLSNDFYDSMQVSPDHPPYVGTNGLVILVHEPHSDFVGQKNLLRGLRALRSANASRKFEFLIEGAYENPDRQIDFNELDKKLDAATGKDAQKAEQLVLDLLSRHIINGPMAYRLLDGQDIPAYAIDDLDQLQEEVGGAPPADRRRELDAVTRILTAVAKAAASSDPETQKQLGGIFITVQAFVTADTSGIEGQQLVDYFDTLAKSLDVLAGLPKQIGLTSPPIAKDVAFLRSQVAAYRREKAVFAIALKRNPTMAAQIHNRVSATNSKISVGFIGSFHTPGVISRLEAAGVGYIVVEPRIGGFSSRADQEAFDRMIHPATREAAIRSALSRNMGPAVPTKRDVAAIARFWDRGPDAPPPMKRNPASSDWVVDPSRLTDAIRSNVGFGAAQLEVRADQALLKVPPEYKGTFAVFEPGGGSKKARVMVLDPKGTPWKGNARYEFLKNAAIVPVVREEQFESRSAVTFFQERSSKQLFAAVHDPASGRFYLMGADDALNVLDHLGPPPAKDGKPVRVHLRMSEIFQRLAREVT